MSLKDQFEKLYRQHFEKLYRQHFEPNGDHNTHSLEWVDHPLDLDGDEPRYLVNHTELYWQFFQAGHSAGLEQAAQECERLYRLNSKHCEGAAALGAMGCANTIRALNK